MLTMNRRIAFTAAVTGLVLALVPVALGGRSSSTSTSTSPAWLTASPDPAAAGGSRVELDGCGFEVRPVQVRIVHSAGYTEIYGAGIWSPGCIDTYFYTAEAGTYTIEVYQSTGTKKRTTLVFKASTVLTVQ
jgi:hypothetical protein